MASVGADPNCITFKAMEGSPASTAALNMMSLTTFWCNADGFCRSYMAKLTAV